MKIKELKSTLSEALKSYSEKDASLSNQEWLQRYLHDKLPDKTVDAIEKISGEIINTIDLMEEKQASLDNAFEHGVSAENWLAKDIMKESGGNAEKAKMAAEFFNGIKTAEASIEKVDSYEIIDVENENWNEDAWNDYRLKDSLKDIAIEAGTAGLREAASDLMLKVAEEGIADTLSDKEFIKDTVFKGAHSGVKTAVSAGLAIAEDKGILPPATYKVLAATAHKTVESFAAINQVLHKEISITDALVKIKNTAVSTFSGMWAQHKDAVKGEIIEAVGGVFGMTGTVIAGAVNGLLAPKEEGPKIVTVLKSVGKAAVNFLTKERHIPFLSKLKNKLLHA